MKNRNKRKNTKTFPERTEDRNHEYKKEIYIQTKKTKEKKERDVILEMKDAKSKETTCSKLEHEAEI